jgi:tripartite-type tricarboxylate transporter receptor subunit TctC
MEPTMGTRRIWTFAAAFFVLTGPAFAQTFPSRPIHIFVPTGPGTPPDIISRVVAKAIADKEGWQVVVENKPGAVQTIAGSEVLKRPADGYSLYALSLPVTEAPAFLANMPFQPDKSFAPVAKLSTSYNVLVVTPSLKVNSVADLVALLKKEPNKLTFSSGGFGTPAHLIGEMFKLKEDVQATHVPYAEMPQAIGDLMSGTNQFMFITTLPVVGLIKSGKLHALAVTGPKRVAALPEVPTVGEQGHPELAVEDWVGLSAKAGTPPAVIEKINAAVNDVLTTEAVRTAFAKLGAEPAGGTPAQFGAFVHSQVEHWTEIVHKSGMKIQQ